MKITFVMAFASMSGGTRVIATHARNLIDRGHDVCVISTPAPPKGIKRTLSTLVHSGHLPQKWKSGQRFFEDARVPHKVLKEFRPVKDSDLPDAEVVVATWWETAKWVADLSPTKGAKAVFIQHYETWGGDPKLVDAAWRLPLHKIVISRWLADLARKQFADFDVSHVPNSVDMELFNAPPRNRQARPTVGMLYNKLGIKGTDVSLKAIFETRKVFPSLQLVSFGPSPISPELPLGAQARYTMDPPQAQLRELYAQCDVWLCGSRSEGFHLPPLEAMACRCPVVSTKVGGPMDIIDEGRNGFLVDIEDPAALAKRLGDVLKLSDEQWREMSDAAYATACRYTWQDAAVLMEQSLESAIAKAGVAR